MSVLDSDLVSRLVKATNDSKPEKNEGVLYGTIVDDGTRKYVHLDGSDGSVNTPVLTTTDISDGDVVMVQLKNHTATVTGNITDPSIGTKRADGLVSQIEQTESSIRLYVADEIIGISTTFEQRASGIEARITNEVAGLNTTITAQAGQIASLITGQNGLSSRIEQTEKGITTLVSNQNEFSEFKQTVEGFSFMGKTGGVKISGGDIELTGTLTWADFTEDSKIDIKQVSADATSAANSATNAANSASSASTSASNASKSATSASTSASNASTYANNALGYANTASGHVTTAKSYASQALANANSAAEAKNAIQSIYNDIQDNLPDYLDSTTITNVSLSSPIIIGGRFYAVDEDAFLEMESTGLRMYVDNASQPKFEIINEGSYIDLIMGSGDNSGNNRFWISKTRFGVSLIFVTTDGVEVGFEFADDGNIYRYPGGTKL